MQQADTMENYILKSIKIVEKKLETTDTLSQKSYLHGQKNILYMILTGYNNPLANPKTISE
jgi:hypothetical protein